MGNDDKFIFNGVPFIWRKLVAIFLINYADHIAEFVLALEGAMAGEVEKFSVPRCWAAM